MSRSERQGAVTVDEAGCCLTNLVDRVAEGEEILITRQGSPVVRMVPVEKHAVESERRAAILALREFASRHRLNGLRVRDLMDEGRR